MNEPRAVYILGLAPVPVDHRVEMRWYQERVSTPVGGSTTRTESQQPWVKDINTGIVYAGHWLFQSGGVHGDRVNVGTREVRSGLTLIETLTGRVLATQVVTVNSSAQTLETMLLVAPDAQGTAYR